MACALPGGPRGQLPWHSCCEARQRRSPPGPARPNSLPLASGRGRKLKTPISLAQGRGSWNEPIKGLLPQLKFPWKLLARCSRALRPSQLRLQTLRRSRNPERNGPAAAGLPQVTQGKPGATNAQHRTLSGDVQLVPGIGTSSALAAFHQPGAVPGPGLVASFPCPGRLRNQPQLC